MGPDWTVWKRVGALLALAAVGVGLIISSGMVSQGLFAISFLGLGCALLAFAGVLSFAVERDHVRKKSANSEVLSYLEDDHAACLVVDALGDVLFANRKARLDLPIPDQNATLAGALKGAFANPVAVLHRLQSKALVQGAGQEDVVTRQGQIRIAVRPFGTGSYVWRVEKVPFSASSRTGANALGAAMLTTGSRDAILFMNDACRRLFGGRAKNLSDILLNQCVTSGALHQMRGQDEAFHARIFETSHSSGRRELLVFPTADVGPSVGGPSSVEEFVGSLPIAMLKLGQSGEILHANDIADDLLASHALVGTKLGSVLGGLGRDVDDWIGEVTRGHGLDRPEVLKLRRKDIERFVEVHLCPIADDPNAVLALMHDATEFKSLELQFVQSQKMQAIGQLAGGVAHDFNNLLTAISGHCDLLLLRHDQGDQDYGDLIQIHQNANRAASLVGQLLAFSRKQNLKPEVLDLRDTLSELTHLLNRLVGEKVTLTLSHDPTQAPVRADKRQLEQVLMNLVVNSRDAMPDGGEIKIATSLFETASPTKRDRAEIPPGTYAQIKVSDCGTGIPAEKIGKIFEPFFTTKKTGEGTGLGLSTAYGIVKQTGGFIFVDSAVGVGTEFTLLFPVHEAGPTQPSLPPLAQPVSKPTPCSGVVLLVEDEAPVRAFASRALSMQGFTVIEADCAEMALETLEDQSLHVDIFVTDVIMPGMDGPTWVRQALETRPETSVVFVSGYAEDAFKDNEKTIQNAVFLPKPFSLSDLTSTVQSQIPTRLQ
ncbi:ATP-binding protein [Nereida sp. MMG025]|uniref:ATP-binding protein n=1 Tax=Nereida sp. MMG025 TaxID=2909981 RepID=UPI001F1B5BA9|nr:ATP-binding protein [Nereida sp. MMG025]MCF6443342.1 ATP-binding protein [Nereida sp. MMG025]